MMMRMLIMMVNKNKLKRVIMRKAMDMERRNTIQNVTPRTSKLQQREGKE